MNVDKLKYNTLTMSSFILALLILLIQVPMLLVSAGDKGSVMGGILDWLRENLPIFIKIPIKFLLSTVLMPFVIIITGLALLSSLIFWITPSVISVIIVINLIALYLTISASTKYSYLTKSRQIIIFISLFVEVINILIYLYIKSTVF